jgi:PST family polysaccharide transporter
VTLRRQLVHGTLWTSAGTYGSAGISFVVTLLLARILVPADFGLVAAIVVFTGFFETIAELGVGSSIVQRQDLSAGELSSLFWAVLGAACAVYGVLILSAEPLARLLGLPLLAGIVPLLGVNAILYGLLTIPLALVRQRLQYKHAAVIQTISAIIGGSVALLLAARGHGYRALVAQSLIVVTARTAGLWIVARWRPRLTFRLRDLGHAVAYSGPVVGSVIINYWSRHLDAILIARVAGVSSLGHYNLAQRLIGAPLTIITAGIRPQLHPLFAPIRDDAERVRRAFRETVAMTALMSFSIAGLLWVVAEPLVLAVWGPAWAPTIPIVRAFSLLAAVQPVTSLSNSLYLTRREQALMLRMTIVNCVALTGAMAIGAYWAGAEGVAWAYSIVYALVASPLATITAYVRLFGGSSRDIARSLGLPSLCAVAILLAGTTTNAMLVHLETTPALRLVTTIVAAGLALLVVARLFAWPLVLSALHYARQLAGPKFIPPGDTDSPIPPE